MKFFTTTVVYVLLSLCGFGQFEDNVREIANWQAEDAPEISPFFNRYHDVWGVEINDRAFAIMSTQKGTHIIDVTDVEQGDSLVSLHFIKAAYQGDNAIHRDYHDYNGHLYVVCDEGPSTLQIIDLTKLPEEPELVYDSDEIFATSHNIFIDTAVAKMYVAGLRRENLLVLNLENPAVPVVQYLYNTDYTHDLFVRDNIGYLNQAGSGLKIVEFGEDDVDVLGTLTEYEDKGYNHSGWLSEDGKYYALCDEDHGYRIKLLDVSDFKDIKVVSLFGSDITDNSVPHNVIIKDHYAFVSYYYDGLQIFDFSNPKEVTKAAQFDTYTKDNNGSFRGVWGVYPNFKSEKILVSDMQTGLYVFEVDLAPVADFTFTADTLAAADGTAVLHLNSTSRWQPESYLWSINDKEVSTEKDYTHNFMDEPIASPNNNYTVCLDVANDQGFNQYCEVIRFDILDVETTNLYQGVNTHLIDGQLFIQFSIAENLDIAYRLNNLNGSVVQQFHQFEKAGEIQHVINLDAQFSNNILILTLQSGNAIWSKKINIIH